MNPDPSTAAAALASSVAAAAPPDDGLPLAQALRQPAALPMLRVRGARTHNLKNIDLDIPKNALVVITGLSGSGKSSLAFDTLYAEGQRRYVESLSAYARQFLQRLDKPDVDSIDGLAPAIAIEQKATSHNPRSTVGTVTEIHDYLRLLYARVGSPHCPEHGQALRAQTVSQMVDQVLALPPGSKILLLAPIARARKGEFADTLAELQAQGFVRFRLDGQVLEAERLPALKRQGKHDLDVVIDRLKVRAPEAGLGATPAPDEAADQRQRLAESFETALRLGDGKALVLELDSGREHVLSARFACPLCAYALDELEPRLFSFNSPLGACPGCEGLGHVERFDPARVVAFPSLSLAAGAIKGWDRRNAQAFGVLQNLAAHYAFDLEAPWENLPEPVHKVLLHGSGAQAIGFDYAFDAGQTVRKNHPFEGLLPNLERRWRESSNPTVREELARLRSTQVCPQCHGSRLRPQARHVYIGEGEQARAIYQIGQITLAQTLHWFEQLQLQGAKAEIGARVQREIAARLRFLNDVGLGYLSLERSAETLSGGEAQRIRLASQIGSGLSGVLYVLDEPSIGLHQRDNERLIGTLMRLRELGNSVLVVEHDEDMIRAADHVIDLGPGAGVHGGRVMAQGSCAQLMATPGSLTGAYLSGARRIEVPKQRKAFDPASGPALRLLQASGHNLRAVSTAFPVGLFTCVTGVSGSGKSTLVNDTLYRAVARHLYRSHDEAAPHQGLEGLEHFDKVINVDQSPIGRTPRSNPATYTGLFTGIRELLAEVPAARERGYGPGRFSFNVAQSAGGGRCEACQGDGVVKVEMHFLPDVYVACEVCQGQRYNRETLAVQYKGKHIAQILELTVEQASAFFQAVPALQRKLQTLLDVGLGYLRLGQSATTLSGGEAQRVKLALELSKRDTGRTLYVLDEPTTGLHFADIELLLKVLHQLRDAGNTIVVIEHNLDVIKTADWLIDLGPEGGAGGGQILVCGTPEQVAACPGSHTGRFLQRGLLGPQACASL